MDNPEQLPLGGNEDTSQGRGVLSANPTKQANPGPLFWIDSTLVFPGKLS